MKETIAERREVKAASKIIQSPSEPSTPVNQSTSVREAHAKFVITRHRALYSNTSELKEFVALELGKSKRQKLNDFGDFAQVDL